MNLFSRIDKLAELQNTILTEQQSSHSRDGGNDDGFGQLRNVSGEVDNKPDPNRRVVLDVKQPGIVYRMWFTYWGNSPELKIYIDGKLVVNETIATLVSGNVSPFIKPLVANRDESSGGYVFYVPMAFKESILIIANGEFYYDINYQKLPVGTELKPFDLNLKLDDALKVLNNVTNDPKNTLNYQTEKGNVSLLPNKETLIYENKKRGQVSAIKFAIKNLLGETLNRTQIKDSKYLLKRGDAVTFNFNVNENAEHVLRFRTIIQGGAQEVDVLVNGISVGKARSRPRRLEGFEWKDNQYLLDVDKIIPINHTKHKKSVTITLVGVTDFILSTVWLLANDTVIDEIILSNQTSTEKHNAIFTGKTLFEPFELEYDPNTLISENKWQEIYHNEEIVNNIWIKVYYDNNQDAAINLPISSFFGYGAFGMFATKSLMIGLLEDGTMYSFYPMPYEENIKITLENRNNTKVEKLNFKIDFEENPYQKNTYGYFKTNYVVNEANTDTELKYGVPITFLNVKGAGHIVNVTHSMTGDYQGEHSRFYLEGDEQIYIDGQLSHSFHGTGTEDFYNGGWYFNNGVQVHPFYGNNVHNYKGNVNRTVMLRTLVVDPIIFRDSIDFKMEHGGWNNRPDSNVYIAVHYYHVEDATIELTDQFDFTNNTHQTKNYQTSDKSKLVNNFKGRYEGFYSHVVSEKTVKAEINEFSEFTVAINPLNQGIIIRVLQDLTIIEQQAKVFIDGTYIGTWNNSFRSAFGGYVRTIEYVVDKKYTNGKSNITIRLENNSDNKDKTPWTELEYKIYSIK